MWGHGSHTSGVIASTNYGLASKANIVMIKCFNDEGVGSIVDVVNGLQWIWNDLRNASDGRVANLINMSLGGTFSSALNQAVLAVIGEGIPIVTAAGNNGGDACTISPASSGGDVLTVSGTNAADGIPAYANGGSCVHIYAPAENVTSTWKDGDSIALLSGTSVATPHVTGVAALILAEQPTLTPKQLKDMLVSCASIGLVSASTTQTPQPQTGNNRLLFQCDGSNPKVATAATSNPQPLPAPSAPPPTDWIAQALANFLRSLQTAQQQQQLASAAPPIPPPCAFGVCLAFGK